MLAIALVLDGADRRTAAEACGMDRQALRDWVHRYNAEGIAGRSNRYSAGPTPLLNMEQKAELARMVREGPELEADGVVRWRCADLKRKIEDRFGVVMHERTVGKQLAALGFRRLSVRPQHPKSDPLAQESFKKLCRYGSGRPAGGGTRQASGGLVSRVSRVKNSPVDCFSGERARGSARDAHPDGGRAGNPPPCAARHPLQMGLYLWRRLPRPRATTAALVMPRADTSAMNAHLAEIAKAVAPSAHAGLVMDGAGWHRSSALCIPDNITVVTLPPYAPELNPVENIWAYLRANHPAITVFDTYDDIVGRCCNAWNAFANDPGRVRSITTREYAKAVNA